MRSQLYFVAWAAGFTLHLLFAECWAQSSSPYWVHIDTAEWDRLSQMRLLDALNRTCPPCDVRVMTEDQWNASRTFVLPQDDFVTGVATSYRADGSQLKYRFYTVPDQAGFDRFVRGELARRGANTVVSGDGHRLTLTTLGLVAHEQPNAPKGLKIKWNDLHVAWHDGVLVWGGSPDIKAVDATSLRKIIRRARGASKMFVVFPAQIPASAKDRRKN